MRAYSMIHVVVIHLGFTRFRNALEKTPAGMVPSPAEYPPELPRGVVADTGTYLCICGPLLLVGPTGHLEIGWAAPREKDSLLPMRALKSDMHHENSDRMITIMTKDDDDDDDKDDGEDDDE